MARWLIKSEPGVYAWEDLVRDGRTSWDGVRNAQARNALRAMRAGDLCLYYHSGAERRVVGVAEVVREAYPDPTANDGDWCAVDVAPAFPLKGAVPLAAIRAEPSLAGMVLLKQGRLSVSPVSDPEFGRILALGKTRRKAV